MSAAEKSTGGEDEVKRRVEAFLEILGRVPVGEVESTLSTCGIDPTAEVAEQVLKSDVCYSYPKSTVRFFRWAARTVPHTACAWNLLVDILGKAGMFEPMWDAVGSMKEEGADDLVSVATFASIFSSYCSRGNVKEAAAAFDRMGRYGVKPDADALNTLLSAMCRTEGRAQDAQEMFERAKTTIAPDANTFAILLEAWEKEGNAQRAKSTFSEMVERVGWDPANVTVYDSFLSTLVLGGQFDEAFQLLKVMRGKGCFPGIKFFTNAVDLIARKGDYANAIDIWDMMISEAGIVPNCSMYNTMIAVCCNVGNMDYALGLLDEMPLNGVFANSITYNAMLGGFIKHRKARDAENFFMEMSKNEQLPTASNCAAAISLFFKEFNPSAAMDMWSCIVEHQITPAEDPAKELITGLLDLGRLTEVQNHVEDMINMRIELPPSIIDNMKHAFVKAGRQRSFEHIARRLKRR